MKPATIRAGGMKKKIKLVKAVIPGPHEPATFNESLLWSGCIPQGCPFSVVIFLADNRWLTGDAIKRSSFHGSVMTWVRSRVFLPPR
jgi:hypothetical protein